MRQMTMVMVAVMLAVTLAAQPKPQEVALQAAIRTETVTGDLRGAIKQYEAIVAQYRTADRPLVARALLRLAACYETLGNGESQAIYRRIVAEYADQTAAAATARARLAPSTKKETGERSLWADKDVPWYFAISPDRRSLAYSHDAGGDVFIRSLATGQDRRITSNASFQKGEWAESMAFSRDGRQLAYAWWTQSGDKPVVEIRIVNLSASGNPVPRTIFGIPDRWAGVYDWTPDGRVLAVVAEGHQASDIVVVDPRDGSRQVLASLDWRGPTTMAVSPDGKHIAFDASATPQSGQADVFVLSGSVKTVVADKALHETVVGWSPDGRYLVYASDAGGGTNNLVAQEMIGGRPEGQPIVLRRHVRGEARGISGDGALVLHVVNNDQWVYTAAVDFASGKLLGKPAMPVQPVGLLTRQPKWSPDGTRLATISSERGNGSGQRVLAMQSSQGTQILRLPLGQLWTYDWSPDGQSFLARAANFSSRQGIYRIAVADGAVTPLVMNESDGDEFAGNKLMPQWAADGKSFFYMKGLGAGLGGSFIQRDLVTGHERQLYRVHDLKTAAGVPMRGMRDHTLSPDRTQVAAFSPNLDEETVLWVVNLADLSVRELLRVKGRNAFATNALVWTADGKAVIVNVRTAGPEEEGPRQLLAVPVAPGAKPVKLDIGVPHLRSEAIAIHPDGRQIAFVAGEPRTSEIRMLENFLPAKPAASRPR